MLLKPDKAALDAVVSQARFEAEARFGDLANREPKVVVLESSSRRAVTIADAIAYAYRTRPHRVVATTREPEVLGQAAGAWLVCVRADDPKVEIEGAVSRLTAIAPGAMWVALCQRADAVVAAKVLAKEAVYFLSVEALIRLLPALLELIESQRVVQRRAMEERLVGERVARAFGRSVAVEAGYPVVLPEITPLAQLERDMVETALLACDGNRSCAAQLLGISHNRLYRLLNKYQ